MRLVSDDTWVVLTLYMEGRGEPYDGLVAIGEVIRNRTIRKFNSNGTIVNTLLRPYQFSGWNTGDPNRLVAALADDTDANVQKCQHAWAEAKGGSELAKGAVFYYNPAIVTTPPSWAKHRVAIYGRHHFFAA